MASRNIEIQGSALALLASAALARGVSLHEAITQALWFYSWATDQKLAGKQLAIVDEEAGTISRIELGRWRDNKDQQKET